MPKGERDAALQEAKLLSALHHPNIVTCYESFTERGRLCIVMDFCSGGDLYQRLKAQKGVALPETQITDWFTQLLLGLKHVHDRRVLHRDLKTQNVFMTADGRCKLGDFGVSKVLSGTTQLASTAVGTPYYLSPEICENRAYNHKSDVWSLGCILYELATLTHPFDGASLKLLILKILRGIYPPVPGRYGKPLKDTVAQMLQKDPALRPSVNDLLARQPFRERARQLLDEEVHADEFSHTVIRHQPVTGRGGGLGGGGRGRGVGGAVDLNEMKGRLSPPRERPAPYPSGGVGIPGVNAAVAVASKAVKKPAVAPPLPGGGGMIGRPGGVRRPLVGEQRAAAVAAETAVVAAAAAAAVAAVAYPPPAPITAHDPGPGARRREADALRAKKAAAAEEQQRRIESAEAARVEQRRAVEAKKSAERAESERRRVADREAARRDFKLRQLEARANRAAVNGDGYYVGPDDGDDDVDIEIRVKEPATRAAGPGAGVAASPPRMFPILPDASFPPVGGAGGFPVAPSEDDRRRVFMENRAAAERNRERAERQVMAPGQKHVEVLGVVAGLDRDGVEAGGAGAVETSPPGHVAAVVAAAEAAICGGIGDVEEERRRMFWEGRAAADRNRQRAMDDEYEGERGVRVGVNEGGARLLIDPGTGFMLGATTAAPTALVAAALHAAEHRIHHEQQRPQVELDTYAHQSGDHFAAATMEPAAEVVDEDIGGVGAASPLEDTQGYGNDAFEAAEDSPAAKPSSATALDAPKDPPRHIDGGADIPDETPPSLSPEFDDELATMTPSKFLLDGKTVELPNIDEGATLPSRVEALRVYLEEVLGESKFIRAYKAMDELNEKDDEESVVGQLCSVMGDDIAYLGLIHQLLVCEDSLHAANSTMTTTVAALTING
jgi:NIMA (never in mitosis gene a)-related kinase